MEFGSPGPLGAALLQRRTVVDPSGRTRAIESLNSTRPACVPRHKNEKGLVAEAFNGIWLPGPDSNQRPID